MSEAGASLPVATGPSRRPPSALLGVIFLLLGGICIGYAPIGLRLSEVGPQATAFWRYTLSVPLFLILMMATHRKLPARPPAAAIVAGVCFALDIGLWHLALTMTSVANATFLVNLGNVSVGLLAWWLLKERPTITWAIAAIVAAAGAACLSLGGQGEGGFGNLRGDGLALCAAFLVAGYMIFAKQARASMDGLSVVFWMTLVEIVVAGLLVIVSGESFALPSMNAFLVVASLAVVAHFGGQGLIILGLGLTPTAIAGILVLIQPVTAAFLSWQLFGETLLPFQVFGAALILLGIALSQRKSRSKAPRIRLQT